MFDCLIHRSKGILTTFTGTESKKIYPNIHQYLVKTHKSLFTKVVGDGTL
jgi:hypothetical protein